MSELKQGIELGSGGLIVDKEVIARLRELPPLPPTDVLRLAAFYKGYQTNRPLADHLALVALMRIVGDPDKELQANINNVLVNTAKSANRPLAAQGSLEDVFDAFSDEGPDDHFDFFLIKQLPIGDSDLNLLVETTERQERFYVIGVSPDVDKLPRPDEEDEEQEDE